jgi:hypothetical protein
MELSGYKSLLKNRNSVKYILLSDDLYPITKTKSVDLNENLFKKSLFFKDFRILREDSVFSIKNKQDTFNYIKLVYNKPDILQNINYIEHFPHPQKYVDEGSE